MTGPERVPRSDIRFNPVGNYVFNQHSVPSATKTAKKKDNAPQPPRPQNAWILYRAWALGSLLERQPELKGTPQSQLSKILGTQWANETPEVRKHFEHQANLNKERHAQAFPDYVFKPQKKEEKEREREKKKQERARLREAVKLRKDIEKSMRMGYLPATMNSIPTPDVLHQLAIVGLNADASPPLSQCPSPLMTNTPVGDESRSGEPSDATEVSMAESNSQGESASPDCIPLPCTSVTPSDACASDANQQNAPFASSNETPSLLENSMTFDASAALGSSSDASFDWSQFASGSTSDIDAFIKQAFPAGMPGPESNRFEMPSGNIVISPGFVDNTQQPNNFDVSRLVSIPLGDQAGILDDEYDCDIVNPHAEREASSSSYDSAPQQLNEAIFMQPFVQLDVSLEYLLSAGKEVSDALLDEQEACENGERVIAAEHVQDGAPAASVAKSGAAAFLPSPPESSSSTTSPLAPSLFEFGGATNLSASSSNQQSFGGLGFSDTMSNPESTSSAWSLPSFGEWGGQDNIGFRSDNDASNVNIQLAENTGECGSGFQTGLFSSVPPTPVSAGSWLGGGFDIGEIAMADYSSTGVVQSSVDDAQAQKGNAWYTSYFDESGSGRV